MNMMSRGLRAGGFGALLWTTALVSPAVAQEYQPPAIPPIRETVDANGVDLISGTLVGRTHSVSIGGPGTMGLSWSRTVVSDGSFRDSTAIVMTVYEPTYTVSVGGVSESFTHSGSDFISDQKTGSTLSFDGTSTYTYTTRDGTVYTLDPWAGKKQYAGNYRVSSITYPTGEKLTFNWETVDTCTWIEKYLTCSPEPGERLRSVQSTNGYKLQFAFLIENPPPDSPSTGWAVISSVTAQNMSVDPASQSWPTLTLNGVTSFTDTLGRVTTYTFTNGNLTAIQRPGASSPNETIGYTGGLVTSVVNEGVSTNYAYSDLNNIRTATISDAASGDRVLTIDLTTGLLSSDKNEAGKTTSYSYVSGTGQLLTVTAPEGNKATFAYDGRGNVTSTTLTPKSGTGSIVTSATYPASDATKTWLCASGTPAVTCNKPLTTTDANGNVTNYSWDSTTGAPSTVTLPAPTTGAVQPKTTYSYSSYYGQYLNSGVLTNFATPVTRLTAISQCQTNASCTGTADEVKTTIAYGTANVLPTSVTQANGTGTVSATSAYTWDNVGNQLTVDGPLSGTADTRRTRYDDDREVVGVVGPDPDGTGSLKNRARRLTYNADGQVTKTEIGTVLSQSDADWANFAPLETVDNTYDSNARPVSAKLSAGGTAYALTQTSYDSLGRVSCTAQRMDPTASLPADVCTLSPPDRISKMTYDPVGRPLSETDGLGATEASTTSVTYTDNGKLATLKDGKNNVTTYVYDGYDRATDMQMPDFATNPSDYVHLVLDNNGNPTSERLRSGSAIALTYDQLNRVTLKGLPGTEPDVSYTYDNLGRVLSANQTGNNLSFTWDALGRNLTQTGPEGTVTSLWDGAGRRTKVTYPGTGLYVNYDYLVTGDVQKIRENGATTGVGVLATYAYDNLGNRTSVTFGNGASETYAYDPVSRLKTLTNNLTGTADDLTIGGSTTPISYNAAFQITSAPRSNSAYSYTGYAASSHAYGINTLNQITTNTYSGTTKNFTYDTNGNLTSDGTSTFGYSSQNQLTSAVANGITSSLTYDPAMRLFQVAGSSTTRFAYDGVNPIAEYDGSNNLLRRYVDAPGIDQPIVWYEGTTIDSTTRRFLSSDERGSIISVSDSSGNKLAINAYDEYGIPAFGTLANQRFGYTGQMWLPEVGLWSYKARMYSPTLGRFMQTDPSGFDGGINLYGYTVNDPINYVDPLGLNIGVPGGTLSCAAGYVLVWDDQTSAYVCTILVNGSRNPNLLAGGLAWNNPQQRGTLITDALPIGTPNPTRGCPGLGSPQFMNKATNAALNSIGQGNSRQTVPLTGEFSQYTGSTDFSTGGWTAVPSEHSQSAYEHSLPNSPDLVVKVYMNDESFGGRNTATITPATYSLGHIFEQPAYWWGKATGHESVNSGNAGDYMKEIGKCPQ
jgi:RHS repeat-associated protein